MGYNLPTFGIAVLCAAASFLTYKFLLKYRALNITKKNDKGVRWASQSKPISGGVGFFVAFVVAVSFVVAMVDHTFAFSSSCIAMLLGSILGFVTGIVDDTKSSSPNFKFMMQILIGLVFVV